MNGSTNAMVRQLIAELGAIVITADAMENAGILSPDRVLGSVYRNHQRPKMVELTGEEGISSTGADVIDGPKEPVRHRNERQMARIRRQIERGIIKING